LRIHIPSVFFAMYIVPVAHLLPTDSFIYPFTFMISLSPPLGPPTHPPRCLEEEPHCRAGPGGFHNSG
jgi:hypothetical protein